MRHLANTTYIVQITVVYISHMSPVRCTDNNKYINMLRRSLVRCTARGNGVRNEFDQQFLACAYYETKKRTWQTSFDRRENIMPTPAGNFLSSFFFISFQFASRMDQSNHHTNMSMPSVCVCVYACNAYIIDWLAYYVPHMILTNFLVCMSATVSLRPKNYNFVSKKCHQSDLNHFNIFDDYLIEDQFPIPNR